MRGRATPQGADHVANAQRRGEKLGKAADAGTQA